MLPNPDQPSSLRPQWGCGEDGQLGLPDAPVSHNKCALDWHVLTPTIVTLPHGETVASPQSRYPSTKAILAGSRNSAVLTSTGRLYTWGWNSHDTLGHDVDDEWIPYPKAVTALAAASKRAAEHDDEATNKSNAKMDEDKTNSTTAVSCASLGGWHACAADPTGRLFAWGGNEYGQAGVDTGTAGRGVHVSLHLSVPELVPFPSGLKITSVSCGGMCSFAVVERTGEVYTWGQTVGSEKEPARSPVRVPGVRGVQSLVAGMFHALGEFILILVRAIGLTESVLFVYSVAGGRPGDVVGKRRLRATGAGTAGFIRHADGGGGAVTRGTFLCPLFPYGQSH